VMLFLNHSCEPNVGFGGNIVLVAMSDIEAGEELSTDYALFDDYEGSMDCNCGRATCRRRIDGDWQRPDPAGPLQERYRAYFSWYLDRQLQSRSLLVRPRSRPDLTERHSPSATKLTTETARLLSEPRLRSRRAPADRRHRRPRPRRCTPASRRR
jgi:hypothetical protein